MPVAAIWVYNKRAAAMAFQNVWAPAAMPAPAIAEDRFPSQAQSDKNPPPKLMSLPPPEAVPSLRVPGDLYQFRIQDPAWATNQSSLDGGTIV